MTSQYPAGSGAINLNASFGKLDSALRAYFWGRVTPFFVRGFTATGSAQAGSSSCRGSTPATSLGILGWRGYFPTMNKFVTGNANSNPVVYIKRKFWEICQGLNVMGVKFLFVATFFTSVPISTVNDFSPFRKLPLEFPSFRSRRFSPFPYRRRVSSAPFSNALWRAKYGTPIACIELISARPALLNEWNSAIRPTFFRAVVGIIGAVFFHRIRGTTNHAILRDGCVFHNTHYTTIQENKPTYCAVILERMTDAFPGIDIYKVE